MHQEIPLHEGGGHGLSDMKKSAPYHYWTLILTLSSTGVGQLAYGSDFRLPANFMFRELPLQVKADGKVVQDVLRLPPQSLHELMAQVSGQRTVSTVQEPQNSPKQVPSIFVQSPKTKGQLLAVPLVPVSHQDSDEAVVLAEAQRLAALDFPLPAKGKSEQPTSLRASRSAPQSETLVLRARGDQLEITPQTLLMNLGGLDTRVIFDPALDQTPQIFLRAGKTLHWDPIRRQLQALKIGSSEIYITYHNQMYILPATIVKSSAPAPLLGEGKSLEQLTSVLALKDQPYTYQTPIPSAYATEANEKPLTLADSAAEVDATRVLTEEKSKRFVLPNPSPEYRSVAVQVIDERSVPENSLLYPVSGVTVRLAGTQVTARTDAKGHALFGEFPGGARFWVSIEDEKGQIVPTMTELSLPRGSKHQVLRARTMSYRTFFAYQSILDLAQDNQLGSFCGRTMENRGKESLEGIRVRLNVEADGPYYIGSFGPQRDLAETSKSGRFCFFNVKPGLVEMSFFRGANYMTALSLPIFPGAHTEEDLPLENSIGRQVYLASLPTAMEQIYEETAHSDLFQPVDAIDLLAIGENESFARVSPNVLGHEAGYTDFKGRLYTLAQAPEFENVVYALDKDKEWSQHMQVLPLLQRGFVEDLFHELNLQDNRDSIAFDPAMGQALIYHTLEQGQGQVKFTLTDSHGRQRDDAWYFGSPSQGNSKAVFFNLQPGVYQLRVEGSMGAIVGLDTFAVDFWTTSLLQTGSSIQYSLLYRREDKEE